MNTEIEESLKKIQQKEDIKKAKLLQAFENNLKIFLILNNLTIGLKYDKLYMTN